MAMRVDEARHGRTARVRRSRAGAGIALIGADDAVAADGDVGHGHAAGDDVEQTDALMTRSAGALPRAWSMMSARQIGRGGLYIRSSAQITSLRCHDNGSTQGHSRAPGLGPGSPEERTGRGTIAREAIRLRGGWRDVRSRPLSKMHKGRTGRSRQSCSDFFDPLDRRRRNLESAVVQINPAGAGFFDPRQLFLAGGKGLLQ